MSSPKSRRYPGGFSACRKRSFRPTALLAMCHCEPVTDVTGCGERSERRQWRKKQGERVAAVKIGGVRHKAARKFCPPQQGHPHSLALHPLSCRPRVTFCHQRQKVTKERRQNQGFEILPRLEHVPCGRTPTREPTFQVYCLAFASSLRLQPLAAHADPRCPVISGMPPASTAQTKNPPHLLPCTRRGDPRGRPRSAPLPCTRRGRPPGRPVSPHSQPITLSLHRTIFISRRISRRSIPAPAIFDT